MLYEVITIAAFFQHRLDAVADRIQRRVLDDGGGGDIHGFGLQAAAQDGGG